MFPNPSKNHFSITFGKTQITFKAKLYNTLGLLIWSKKINNSAVFQFKIDQPTGVYYLEIIGLNNEKAYIKLLKN